MFMMKQLLLKVLLISLLSVNVIAGGVSISTNNPKQSEAPLQTPEVYIDPQNGTATVGSLYNITVKISDVTNLYAFDIQMRWGTAVLKYHSRTLAVGLPGGVLINPTFQLKNVVNETASIAGAAVGTTYWIAYLSYAGAPAFNGTGTVFNMTFDVLRDGECDIYFTKTALSDKLAQPIVHETEDGYFYRAGLGQVPIADFTFFPDPAVKTKTTMFDASSSHDQDGGNIARYIWNFRDGTITNTTNPTINHTFASIPAARYYDVELTVLDDQGGGSQSKPMNKQVNVVEPNPVAEFTVWPDDQITVVNKATIFNASDSHDPDPGGSIVEYQWDFGDGNQTTIDTPIIEHKFADIGNYIVKLVVVDSSDSLESSPKTLVMEVVESRDIEATSLTVSPSAIKQGEEVAINVTAANKGQADENFNITAYYNTTLTDFVKIDELPVSAFPKQYIPVLELFNSIGANSTVDCILKDWVSGSSSLRNETKIRVGTNVGFWTINPGKSNSATNSPGLVTGTPLTTGGWIWEKNAGGSKKLNGQFSAGNWSFQTRLYTTAPDVSGTIWVRILKSDNPDPHAVGASVAVVKDWTYLFPATPIPTSVTIFNGNVSAPSFTLTDEYIYFEFQLQVTSNPSGGATTDIIFQVGGPTGDAKAQIKGTAFSYHNTYAILWNTEFVSLGNHTIRVETSEVPQETNTTNNVLYGTIYVAERPSGVAPLDITIDVGSIHFGGETAEFYILVASSGRRVDASLTEYILFNGTMTQLNSTAIESVGTGLYLTRYQIPVEAPSGTYTLVVDASRLIIEEGYTQRGTALKSFLLSQTLTDWGAMLTEIEGNTATILTSVGEIKANLTAINATLSGLIFDSKGEILAQIDTALGTLTTRLDTINATVTDIEGNTLTINSTLGETKSSLGAVQTTMTIGLAAASILSAVAAIVAILIFLRIRKPTK